METIEVVSLHAVHVSISIIALDECSCPIKESCMTHPLIPGLPAPRRAEVESPHGLLLPPGIVQPFDLRFTADDLHVIAYFKGHAEYEAVEAMIQQQGEGRTTVRAILTRHDQTQVDHVNDEATCGEAQVFEGRRTVHRDVEVKEDGAPGRPCVTVRFVSFANETVQLRLQAASPPDAAKGGLTDPGRHAPTSSLPLMWREKSCLAGPGSTVTIDGVGYDLSERVRSPQGFVGLSGFYTKSHLMGAMRASTCAFEVMQEPSQIELGSTWVYAGSDGHEARCIVSEMPSSQQAVVTVSNGLRSERVLAEVEGRCLRLMHVESLGPDALQPGFSLHFIADGHFAMDVAGNRELVTGRVEHGQESRDSAVIGLLPEAPAWTCSRAVTVRIRRRGNRVELITTIG